MNGKAPIQRAGPRPMAGPACAAVEGTASSVQGAIAEGHKGIRHEQIEMARQALSEVCHSDPDRIRQKVAPTSRRA